MYSKLQRSCLEEKFCPEVTSSSIVCDVVSLQYLCNKKGFALRKVWELTCYTIKGKKLQDTGYVYRRREYFTLSALGKRLTMQSVWRSGFVTMTAPLASEARIPNTAYLFIWTTGYFFSVHLPRGQ
jgi:hypothetical protein